MSVKKEKELVIDILKAAESNVPLIIFSDIGYKPSESSLHKQRKSFLSTVFNFISTNQKRANKGTFE